VAGGYDENSEMWIPRVTVRRMNDGAQPLESTFVAVVEPWRASPLIQGVRRMELKSSEGAVLGDTEVALEIALPDGSRDLVMVRDPERAESTPLASCSEDRLISDGQLALLRLDAEGHVRRAAVALGARCSSGDFLLLAEGSKKSAEYSGE
jgi:hypothetical protein